MRKMIKRIVITTLFIFNIFCLNTVFANSNIISVVGATYEVTENVISQDIGYNIKHTKDIAQSSKKDGELFPQSVNVLEIPSREDVKIINWTMSNNSGWSKSTVRKMAQDFESKNPGWVVVAAINGDFFDINGTDKRLPYQTGGVTVSNGEVYRPFTNSQTIGFKNDASTNPLVAEKKFEVSAHMLSIYDANDNIIYTKEVKYFNEIPSDNEVAVWYSYRDTEGLIQRVTLPKENSYLIKTPTRFLPMSLTNVYGNGIITSINEEVYMHYGQFGIQTDNEEIKNLLDKNVKIRIQQNVIGDYQDCTDITGGGVCLVRGGSAVDNTSNMDTHPRTCVGVKSDGTIVFMTVDGRQDNRNMHGMAYNELSATMLYYGCNEAYNLDGGGSTTMIIRNSYGDFDVMNSPSDGTERNDSNSLLVVVPELALSIENVSDTNVVINYTAAKKDVIISDINVTINNETRKIDSFPYVWEGLNPITSYTVEANYKLQYKSSVETKSIIPIQIKTGFSKPTVDKAFYYEYGDNIILNYKILNDSNVTCLQSLMSGMYFNSLNHQEGKVIISKSQIDINNIVINLGYNIKSSHSEYVDEEFKVTKIIFDYQNALVTSLDPSNIYNGELPTLNVSDHLFLGWEYNEKVITSFDEITTNEEIVTLKAVLEPLNDNNNGGCKKTSATQIIEILSVVSVALLIFKKKY